MATKTSLPKPDRRATLRADGALQAVVAFVAGSIALSSPRALPTG